MSASSIREDTTDRRALGMLLASIVVCSAVMAFDTILVVKITAFYSITDTDFGVLFMVSCILMAAASMPWGYSADRFPRIPIIRLSLGLIGLSLAAGAAAFFFDLPYEFYFGSKILAGLALAGVGPIATSAVMDTVPMEKRGATYGWVGVSWAAGAGAGLLMPAVCMELNLSLGATHALGAGAVFIFTASMLFVPEPERGSRDEALRNSTAAYDYLIRPADLRPLISRPVNVLLIVAMLLFQFPLQTIGIWFVTFMIRNQGATEFSATILMIIAFMGQPFGNALGGSFTDRAFRARRSGRVQVMIALTVAAPVFMAAAFSLPFHMILFAALMIGANFFIVASGPGLATVSLEANLPEHRGTISAVMAVCSNFSRALGWYFPPLIAASFSGRYDHAFLAASASYIPLIIVYILLSRRIGKDLDYVQQTLTRRAQKD